MQHPNIFHLVQAGLWQQAVTNNTTYYPPTYDQDGFTHGTANPAMLLNVANHFYQDVPGDWLCLQMTQTSIEDSGVTVIFEGTAAVGDIQPDFEGTDDELFPHIKGGIHPSAVLAAFPVERNASGEFLNIESITDA